MDLAWCRHQYHQQVCQGIRGNACTFSDILPHSVHPIPVDIAHGTAIGVMHKECRKGGERDGMVRCGAAAMAHAWCHHQCQSQVCYASPGGGGLCLQLQALHGGGACMGISACWAAYDGAAATRLEWCRHLRHQQVCMPMVIMHGSANSVMHMPLREGGGSVLGSIRWGCSTFYYLQNLCGAAISVATGTNLVLEVSGGATHALYWDALHTPLPPRSSKAHTLTALHASVGAVDGVCKHGGVSVLGSIRWGCSYGPCVVPPGWLGSTTLCDNPPPSSPVLHTRSACLLAFLPLRPCARRLELLPRRNPHEAPRHPFITYQGKQDTATTRAHNHPTGLSHRTAGPAAAAAAAAAAAGTDITSRCMVCPAPWGWGRCGG